MLTLANRHDWLAAFCNELAVALAVERMTGMDVPVRAQWLRTLLCELNRLMAHLVFLAPLTRSGIEDTDGTRDALRGREAVQAVLEEASGGRIHFMFNRIGGLREDVPAGGPTGSPPHCPLWTWTWSRRTRSATGLPGSACCQGIPRWRSA